MLWRWLKSSQHNPITLWLPPKYPQATVKRATKTYNLFCNKTSWKVMLGVLPPTIKPVLQEIRLLQVVWVLTPDWIKLQGSNVTCCKASLPWAGKTRNMYRLCCEKQNYSLLSATLFRNLQQPDLLPDGWQNEQHRYSTQFAEMFQNKSHVFAACFTVPLRLK